MRFDYTHGERAKYVVSVSDWNCGDLYYTSNIDSAMKLFRSITKERTTGMVSVYDLDFDGRMAEWRDGKYTPYIIW